MLSWLRAMKDSLENEKKPEAVAEAESMLNLELQRMAHMHSHEAAFSTTCTAGQHLLDSGISICREEITKEIADLSKVMQINRFTS